VREVFTGNCSFQFARSSKSPGCAAFDAWQPSVSALAGSDAEAAGGARPVTDTTATDRAMIKPTDDRDSKTRRLLTGSG
jgi:hypothetical protein